MKIIEKTLQQLAVIAIIMAIFATFLHVSCRKTTPEKPIYKLEERRSDYMVEVSPGIFVNKTVLQDKEEEEKPEPEILNMTEKRAREQLKY